MPSSWRSARRSMHRTPAPSEPGPRSLAPGPGIAAGACLLVAAVALLTVPPTAAGTCDGSALTDTLYGLAQDGRLTINGTTVKTYASEFHIDVDVDDDFLIIVIPGGIYIEGGIEIEVDNPKQLWSSLAVDGSTRWALRRDGKLRRNDESFATLPTEADQVWLDMAAGDGRAYSLRSDGLVMADDVQVASHPAGGFYYRRLLRDGGDLYAMRSDGTVFRNGESSPVFEFHAGIGDSGFGDGVLVETTWIAMAVDSSAGFLYALRCDGHVFRGLLGTGGGEQQVASLPYDRFTLPYVAQVFVDLALGADGIWFALAGDGRVYTQDDHLVPLADLPGNASQTGRVFVDVETFEDAWFALRTDGQIFRNGVEEPLIDLPGETHGSMALSDVAPPPVEEGSKDPKATYIKTKTVLGTPLRLPVVVTDADTCPTDLVITPVDPLPPGATWDAAGQALIWDAPSPAGGYVFRFSVTDGANSVKFTYDIKIKEPDVKPDRNAAPLVPKIGTAQAIAGLPFELTLVVDDPDGDPVTVSVDPAKPPFTLGATFDPATLVFSWTPAAQDVGEFNLKFTVSDGKATKTVKTTLKVKSSLIF